MIDQARLSAFREALGALITRFGGVRDEAAERTFTHALEEALAHASSDGESLSPLDVVRIRAGKFAASRVPAAVFRAPGELAALRGHIVVLARELVGEAGRRGSRFD